MERIVLAYSGGLDATAAIPWLRTTRGAEVVTVTLDLGQGGELESIRDRALAAGAARAHVLDLRDEFAGGFVLPSLRADALFEHRRPMTEALGRPLIGRTIVEIARIEQAAAVAHGCGRSGPDRLRIERAVAALEPGLPVLAPACHWSDTRVERLAHARACGIPMPPGVDRPWRHDVNLWGRSLVRDAPAERHGEPLEPPWVLTRPATECPDRAAFVEIAFARGVPTAINGVEMPLVDLVASLATIAGAHGVGRIDLLPGASGRRAVDGMCEAPAAVLLHTAYRALQRLVAGPDLDRMARRVSREYADLVHEGRWFTPLRAALDGFVEQVAPRVSGSIRLKLVKGAARIVRRRPAGIESPPSVRAMGVPADLAAQATR